MKYESIIEKINKLKELGEFGKARAYFLVKAFDGEKMEPLLRSFFETTFGQSLDYQGRREVAYSPGYGIGLSWCYSKEELSDPYFVALMKDSLDENGKVCRLDLLELSESYMGVRVEFEDVGDMRFEVKCYDGNEWVEVL